MNRKEVQAAMLAKLKTSGLTEEDAALSKFTPLTAEELRAKYPKLTTHPAAGFKLPFPNTKGFYRFRYLEQPPRNGVSALTKQKPWRYIQPAGIATAPYFSPIFPWEKFFANPPANWYLLIVEGELKAACACKQAFPCIGIGGVWNFKAKNNRLLPELAKLPLKDRPVYTIYDSDACTNPNVQAALNALAKELLARGAKVFPIILPALKGFEKTGLDDFIVEKGEKALEELIKKAKPWTASEILHELNEQIVMLHVPGDTVLELSTMQRYAVNIFKNSLYANREWYEVIHVQATAKHVAYDKVVRKNAAAEWIKWPHRTEVARAVYEPGKEQFVDGGFNTWRGWGVEPKKGDVTLWHRYMDFYFEKTPAANRKWFTQWLSYPLQHPGAKLMTAVVAYGVEGSGKSLLGYTMERIYGKKFIKITESELLATFNDWAEDKQFVMGEEITGGNKRGVADLLKDFITGLTKRINPKYIKAYDTRDTINYYFCSNHPDAFFLNDGSRRYFVHELQCGKLVDRDKEFVVAYDKWFRSEEGAAALFHYLLQVDLKDFDPKAPALETEARKEMIDTGRSELESWVARLRDDPDSVLVIAGGSVVTRSLMTLEEIFACWDPLRNKKLTTQGLRRALTPAGFRMVGQLTIPGGLRPSVWAVRNREKLEAMNVVQLAEVYCKEWGIERPAPAPYGSKKGGK
jgi:hypothetical protein